MFIIKGGISREIDEKNLQEYLDKGYKTFEESEAEQEKPKETKKG